MPRRFMLLVLASMALILQVVSLDDQCGWRTGIWEGISWTFRSPPRTVWALLFAAKAAQAVLLFLSLALFWKMASKARMGIASYALGFAGMSAMLSATLWACTAARLYGATTGVGFGSGPDLFLQIIVLFGIMSSEGYIPGLEDDVPLS